MSWPKVALGEVFEISSSKRVLKKDWQTSGIPFYRAREIVQLSKTGRAKSDLFITEDLFDELGRKYGVPCAGDLMVSAVGTLGACYQVKPEDRFYFKDASVLRLHPKTQVSSRYIEHAFKMREVVDQIHSGSGSTVGTLTISRANNLQLPLPPLEEQKRIAAILDKADELRGLRRRAIDRLDTLAQSIFYDMFGDLRTAKRRGLNHEQVGLLADVELGKMLDKGKVRGDRTLPYLRNANVRWGYFELNDIEEMQFFERELERYAVLKGDILMCEGGEPGRCAIWDKEDPIYYQKALHRIRVDGSKLLGEFFVSVVRNMSDLNLLDKDVSSVTIKHLTKEKLQKLEVITPPIEEQRVYASRIGAINFNRYNYLKQSEDAEALFASLQQRAFRGEL